MDINCYSTILYVSINNECLFFLNRSGTIKVNYTLSTKSDAKGEIIDAVRDLIEGKETIILDGTPVSVTEGSIQSSSGAEGKEAGICDIMLYFMTFLLCTINT